MLADEPDVKEFGERWEASGGAWYTAQGLDHVIATLGRAFHDLMPNQFDPGYGPLGIYWVHSDLDAVDFHSQAQAWGLSDLVRWDDSASMRDMAQHAVVGLTACAWAVASTASVALYSSPETGLLPSVLPPMHLMLVRRNQLVRTVADGLNRVDRSSLAPVIKLISGPSATADIEGTLVRGVHGPGRVGVVLYDL